jgi:hypothetical protein
MIESVVKHCGSHEGSVYGQEPTKAQSPYQNINQSFKPKKE